MGLKLRLFLKSASNLCILTRTSDLYEDAESFAIQQASEYGRTAIAWDLRADHPDGYGDDTERLVGTLLAIWKGHGLGENAEGDDRFFISWMQDHYSSLAPEVLYEAQRQWNKRGVTISAPAQAGPRKPPPQVPVEVWRDAYKMPAFDPAQAWDALQAVCKGQRGS